MITRGVLTIVLGGLLLSSVASADVQGPINCLPLETSFLGGTGGPNPVMCPPFSIPGGNLTGVTLSYIADYNLGLAGTNTIQMTFVPAGPGGVIWNLASTTLTQTGGASSGAPATGSAVAASGISTSAFSLPFNVNVSSVVTAGTVGGSSGAVSVTYTFTPPGPLTLACPPASNGTVGTPYSSAFQASGGVTPYVLFALTSGGLPPGLLLNGSTGAITGTPTTAGTFPFTAQVTDSLPQTASTAVPPGCSITISTIPPPPPPSGACTNSAGSVIFPDGGIQENSFLVRYASNLDKGDGFVNVTNTGLNGAPPLGPGFGPAIGNLCVNVYTFSPDEQLVSCCSCLVTPNALQSFSVNADLLNTTLTQVVPNSVVIKMLGSDPATNILRGGMAAWGTTIHNVVPTPLRVTETPFSRATLSGGEFRSIVGRCASIIGNGTGLGQCKTCRAGGLGANRL